MSTLKANRYENTASSSGGIDIDSSGKIGCGTSSPSEILHVNGTSTAIKIDSDGDAALRFATSGTNKFSIFQSSGTLRFFDNTNNAERMRILSSGGLTFNGDTAAANALDDYEEGTWTATLSVGTCTTSDAKYIKIGKLVRVSATLSGFSDRSSSAGFQITNAPFAGNLTQKAQAAGTQIHRNLDLAAVVSYISSTGNIEFYAATSGSWSQLAYNELNSSSSTIYFNAQWMTN